MKQIRVPVAVEGYPFIAISAMASLVTAVLGYDLIAMSCLALTGFILYFFRDPCRICPEGDDVFVSPADGKIILIDKVFDDRFVNEHVYKISIFMNIFNVHVNRIPFPGVVEKVMYSPGRFYSANTERGAIENEYCAVVLKTKMDKQMAVVQVAGLIARRIVCWATKADTVTRGQRFGLIRFGSRVDMYLPTEIQLEVALGQRVKAGETVLAYQTQQ